MNVRTYSWHRIVALVVVVAMCCSLGVTASASGTFVDVPEDSWYYEAVMRVTEEGLFNGTDATHFSPEGTLNRAMFVTVMWRYDGKPDGGTPAFLDVDEGDYFFSAVGWASGQGLVNGISQDLFAPGRNIIREQMAVLMYRYAVYKGVELGQMADLSKYSDASTVSGYAKEAVSWAIGNGLLLDSDGAIRPVEDATRAEAAVLWAGFMDNFSDSNDSDDDQNGKDGKSAYELAVENGYEGTVQEWLASLVGETGADGKSAYEIAVRNGYQGTEIEWLRSLAGANGLSAYEIAVKNGYKGTEVEWLASLVGEAGAAGKDGANGASAYELAVANGYKGTLEEWLLTLVGPTGAAGADGKDGVNGKSAYELAVEQGFKGTLAEWLDSLSGDGKTGADGKSAYELAVANGFDGSVTEWLASLVGAAGKDGATGAAGADGESAYDLAVANGYEGTVQQWLASLVGAAGTAGKDGRDGEDGKSAYDLAVENGYKGTEAEWLASLVGAAGAAGKDGQDGEDGKSAYELAVENGFEGTEEEWLESLKGEDGKAGQNGSDGKDGTNGKDGVDGEDGKDGADGVSVVNAYINDDMHLILVMSDGTEVDAGYVGVPEEEDTFTVTFMDYDHRILWEETVKKGGNATAPVEPTREGYTFVGWNRSYTNVTADIVVYALYEENESEAVTYTVKFVDYDGSIIDNQIVKEGEDAVAPADPIRDGYNFVGWDTDFTDVRSNLTVKAMYEAAGAYLSSDNQIIEKNTTLKIPVNLNNCSTQLKTLGISISNVPSGFTISKGSWSSDYEYEMSNFNKTRLQGASTFVEPYVVDGEIFVFQFAVSDTVETGSYTLNIEMILKYFDENGDEVEIPCQPLEVQITVN